MIVALVLLADLALAVLILGAYDRVRYTKEV